MRRLPFDFSTPKIQFAILQQFEAAMRDVKPVIPLGTRGKLRGTDYELHRLPAALPPRS